MFESTSPETKQEPPFVILAALETDDARHFAHRLEEMQSLIEACDMRVCAVVTQKLPHPEPGTYLGKGKALELCERAKNAGISRCIFEDNLSPVQLKNLSRILEIEVWDRTTLILEIFSRRAGTREAKLQVESAYLQYMLPRLSGMWQHLGRQGGGGGSRANKGIGETQLELDRRQIQKRISSLSRELETIRRTRDVQRQGRSKGTLPRAALVGYTNAGKSTIMNAFLQMGNADEEKQVFEKDMLFATLDTSVRHIRRENKRDFLLSDTVGFIENLPHGLIKAFRSTLEEASQADLILVVLDASDEYCREHREVTEKTLKELHADTIPRIYVMNKADNLPDISGRLPIIRQDEIWICARTGTGLKELADMITGMLYNGSQVLQLKLPFVRGDLLNLLHSRAHVFTEEYDEEGILVTADCPQNIHKILLPYTITYEFSKPLTGTQTKTSNDLH